MNAVGRQLVPIRLRRDENGPFEGFAIGPGVWAVALLDLAKLNLNVPVEVSGRSNLLITLVDVGTFQ